MSFAIALPPLHRAYRAAADKAVAHVGLSQALAWPMVFLGRLGGDVRPGVLADALGIEAPSIARSVEQLLESGLAERRDDPQDRRAKILNLTPAGHAARDQIEAALDQMRDSVFDGISDKDLATCLRVFATIGQRVGCAMPVVPGLQGDDEIPSSTGS
ncbi:MarR family transcriptional regulator [Aquabacterium soli]|uniref:MarR family transcriptional regulator n=2 Tax=Aquabacterium soli TaxID=2493092 RepID=A0A426V994_9BURK|nr:MarR family transcriptional regulator [Aquabacterium soli]